MHFKDQTDESEDDLDGRGDLGISPETVSSTLWIRIRIMWIRSDNFLGNFYPNKIIQIRFLTRPKTSKKINIFPEQL